MALCESTPQHTRRAVAAAAALVMLALALLAAPVPASALPVTVEQADARWSYSGMWSQYPASEASGGSHALSVDGDAAVTLTFVGTRLDLLGMTGPKGGMATVTVDGALAVTIDQYSATTRFGQTVFSTGDLAAGLHVVRVVGSGTGNPASAGTVIALDAVAVEGTLTGAATDQADRRIVMRGAWSTPSAPVLFGGSQAVSPDSESGVAVSFQGTCLDLVAMTGPKMGIAAVSVDGGPPVDVSLYSATTRFQQVVYSTGQLPPGQHTVLVEWTGRADVAAGGSALSLDAVLVTGALTQATMLYQETDPRLAWGGSIAAEHSPALLGGRHAYMGAPWGAVAVAFEGGRLDWYAVRGPQYGIAVMTVDGVRVGEVDLYAPVWTPRELVYSTGDVAWGTHSVVVRRSGRRSVAAYDAYVSVDAFGIAGSPVQAAAPPAPPPTFNYPWARYIVVDKSDFRVYLVEDGVTVREYPCAVGALGMETPNTYWRIDAKYYTDPTSVYGPRKMRMFRQSGSTFVYTAYNIHGTNDESSIGTRASHGCIRLYNKDILELFDLVPLGTMVVTRN